MPGGRRRLRRSAAPLLVALLLTGLGSSPAARAQTPAIVDSAGATLKPTFYGYTGVYYGYDFNVPHHPRPAVVGVLRRPAH